MAMSNNRIYVESTSLSQVHQIRWLFLLVQETPTPPRPTVTVQLAVLVLDGELVVISELLSPVNLPQGKDHDVLATIHVYDSRVAVRLTRVVDETSSIALHRCVHHIKIINAEHVTANALESTAQTRVEQS